MTGDLVLYSHPKSRGRAVRWMLEEVGAPYRAQMLPFGAPMRTEEFRAMNPMGKVPVLVHGRQVVTETAAICMHLADAFPERGLAPPHDRRGAYYRWIAFATGPLEAALTSHAMGWQVPEDRGGMVGYGDLDRVVATLEAAMAAADNGAGYVADVEFTAADICLGTAMMWGVQSGALPSRPAFQTYFAHLGARPARARAAALDDTARAEMEKETDHG